MTGFPLKTQRRHISSQVPIDGHHICELTESSLSRITHARASSCLQRKHVHLQDPDRLEEQPLP